MILFDSLASLMRPLFRKNKMEEGTYSESVILATDKKYGFGLRWCQECESTMTPTGKLLGSMAQSSFPFKITMGDDVNYGYKCARCGTHVYLNPNGPKLET